MAGELLNLAGKFRLKGYKDEAAILEAQAKVFRKAGVPEYFEPESNEKQKSSITSKITDLIPLKRDKRPEDKPQVRQIPDIKNNEGAYFVFRGEPHAVELSKPIEEKVTEIENRDTLRDDIEQVVQPYVLAIRAKVPEGKKNGKLKWTIDEKAKDLDLHYDYEMKYETNNEKNKTGTLSASISSQYEDKIGEPIKLIIDFKGMNISKVSITRYPELYGKTLSALIEGTQLEKLVTRDHSFREIYLDLEALTIKTRKELKYSSDYEDYRYNASDHLFKEYHSPEKKYTPADYVNILESIVKIPFINLTPYIQGN